MGDDKIVQYSTNSLPLASYLKCHDEVSFVGAETDKPIITFVFSPQEEAKKIADAYFAGGEVSAIQLFQEYRILKDLLFEAKRNSSFSR